MVEKFIQEIIDEVLGPPIEAGSYYKTEDGSAIYVVNGRWMGQDGLCNFWYWKPLLADGTLGPEKHGYGGKWTKISRDEALKVATAGTPVA